MDLVVYYKVNREVVLVVDEEVDFEVDLVVDYELIERCTWW